MPIPPILKILWLGKYGIYPTLASIWEYRGKKKCKKGPTGEVEARFWHIPFKALCDRRLWVRHVTNGAEAVVHFVAPLRFGYGFISRRFRLSYRTYTHDHEQEAELFRKVEYSRWRRVLRKSLRWLKSALHYHEQKRLTRPEIGNLLKRSTRWKKIRLDGLVIAAYVPRRKVRPTVREYARSKSALRIRLIHQEGGHFEVLVVQDGTIVQRLQVTESAVNNMPLEIGG